MIIVEELPYTEAATPTTLGGGQRHHLAPKVGHQKKIKIINNNKKKTNIVKIMKLHLKEAQ